MATVRDVITEAFNRTNLVPRKRDLPPDMFITGMNLLKGVLQDFSNKRYIQAYKSEFEFVPNKEKTIVGPFVVKKEYKDTVSLYEYDYDRPNPSSSLDGKYCYVKADKMGYQCQGVAGGGYAWIQRLDFKEWFEVLPDIEITDLMTPTQSLFKEGNSTVDWIPQEFISYDQFYSVGYSDYVVSWKPVYEGTYELYFKTRFVQQPRIVKIIYNIEMDYKDNDNISLPAPYLELLTRALAYKCATAYPRVDATKVGLLKAEFDELTQNLEASNASQRILTRDNGYGGRTRMGEFLDGSFISSRWY